MLYYDNILIRRRCQTEITGAATLAAKAGSVKGHLGPTNFKTFKKALPKGWRHFWPCAAMAAGSRKHLVFRFLNYNDLGVRKNDCLS
jgi:hypothetical protein